MWVYGLDWAGPGQRQVADDCECSNEPSGSVKCGEFLDQLLKKDSAPWSEYVSKGLILRLGYVLEYLLVSRTVVKRVLFKWFKLTQFHGPNKLVKQFYNLQHFFTL